jgi:hypothetical protein
MGPEEKVAQTRGHDDEGEPRPGGLSRMREMRCKLLKNNRLQRVSKGSPVKGGMGIF